MWGVVLPALVIGVAVLPGRFPLAGVIDSIEGWVVTLGIWGPIVFGLLYVAAVLALVPASALTLAAGAMFGVVVGTITTSLASTTGAALAFLITRHLVRDRLTRKLGNDPRFTTIDQAIARQGWIIVGLLRLSPAVPFNLQNYLYGLTGIGFWTCVLTSWVAMLPGTILYVYLGHVGRLGLDAAVGGAGRSPTVGQWALLAVGLMATLAVSILLGRMARRAMHERSPISEPAGTDGSPTLDVRSESS